LYFAFFYIFALFHFYFNHVSFLLSSVTIFDL